MKYLKNVGAQGELRFVRLSSDFKIPKKAIKEKSENGYVIVGHSETGHHHVMDSQSTTMYRLPESILECLLVVEKPNELKHLREYDTHESWMFEPGIYKVTTAREYIPKGWRKTAD